MLTRIDFIAYSIIYSQLTVVTGAVKSVYHDT